jgi:hypothetical protein
MPRRNKRKTRGRGWLLSKKEKTALRKKKTGLDEISRTTLNFLKMSGGNEIRSPLITREKLGKESAVKMEVPWSGREKNGWDERDYQLWSAIMNLPSYGLIADDVDNPMLSRKALFKLMSDIAGKRFLKWLDDKVKEKVEPNEKLHSQKEVNEMRIGSVHRAMELAVNTCVSQEPDNDMKPLQKGAFRYGRTKAACAVEYALKNMMDEMLSEDVKP